MAAKGFTVKVKKDLDMRKFADLLKRAEGTERSVGVGYPQNGKKEEDGTPVAMIAAVHNYGATIKRGNAEIKIPERPFLEPALKKAKPRLIALNRENIVKVLQGKMTITQALGQMGEMAKGAVQQEIKNGEFAPLAPATIKAKGSSRPLIDTGNLIQSTAYILDPPKK